MKETELDIPFVLSRMNYRKSDLTTGPYGASDCASCVFQYKLLRDTSETTCTLVNVLLREWYGVEKMTSTFLIEVGPEAICDAHLHRGTMNGYSPHDINRFAKMYAALVPIPQYYRSDTRATTAIDSRRLCPRHNVPMTHGGTINGEFDDKKMILQILYCKKGCTFFEKIGVPEDED